MPGVFESIAGAISKAKPAKPAPAKPSYTAVRDATKPASGVDSGGDSTGVDSGGDSTK